ncbi:MAG TPA: class I SAM-dependent methyltransferase [Planctomycetota bacterium]|nr:class I SAM-dependent methyltransferase [Planctomycetota bacterium]
MAIPAVAAPDPAVLTEVRCGLCGSARARLRFADPPYRVVRCEDCGLVYVTPRRDEGKLREMYAVDYWRSPAAKDFGYTDYLRDEPLYRRTYRRRFAVVRRHCSRPGRVLDVGCAAGFFLSVAKEEGWRCTGVEVSPAMSAFARERYGLDVRVGTLADQHLDAASFDLVTFWDVVEHLPDPISVLREARRLVAPGGRVLVETQNVASLFARVLGRRWQHYKHAEHLYHFDPSTVRRLLGEAGLEAVEVGSALGGKYVSLEFVVERAQRVHPALSKVLSPLRAIGRRSLYVNLFDEMVVVARAKESEALAVASPTANVDGR